MESLKKLNCFICNKDIEDFYNYSSKMIAINHQLMDKIVRQTFGIKVLSAGRIVVLNSSVSWLTWFRGPECFGNRMLVLIFFLHYRSITVP